MKKLALFMLVVTASIAFATETPTPTPVPELPDLEIIQTTYQLENPYTCWTANSQLGVAIYIKNTGKTSTSTPFFVDLNGQQHVVPVVLPPDAMYKLWIASGSTNLTITLDKTEIVPEKDEDNNKLVIPNLPVPTPPISCSPTATGINTTQQTVVSKTATPTSTGISTTQQTVVSKTATPTSTSTTTPQGDYRAKWISQTQGTGSPFNAFKLKPGESVTITAKFQNVGTKTWYNDTSRSDYIGFYVYKDLTYSTPPEYNDAKNPLFGQSYFKNSSWGPNFLKTQEYARAALLQESSVKPGETGSFVFSFTVPSDAKPNSLFDTSKTKFDDRIHREDLTLATGPNWMQADASYPKGTGDPQGYAHVWFPIKIVGEEPSSQIETLRQYAFDKINESRAQNNLAALEWMPELAAVTQAHAEDLALHPSIGHLSSDGTTFAQRLINAGIISTGYKHENWVWCASQDKAGVDKGHAWLMNDPPHRKGILSPNYTKGGVGIGFSGTRMYMVHDFILPK